MNGACATVLDDARLGVFERVLLTTDGTVVRLLEGCFNERVRTAHLEQSATPAGPGDGALELRGDETVLRRSVLLEGARTRRTYLHAESAIVLERLPARVRDGLLSSSDTIGRLLTRHRVETFREILEVGRAPAGELAAWFGLDDADDLWFRSYRIVCAGRPAMLIEERFPARGLSAFIDVDLTEGVVAPPLSDGDARTRR